jgi:hypothetical protein
LVFWARSAVAWYPGRGTRILDRIDPISGQDWPQLFCFAKSPAQPRFHPDRAKSKKKGNSARLRVPEDRGGLSSSDHSRATMLAYLCQSWQVQKGMYKRKLRRGVTCWSGYVVLFAMRKSRRSDRSVLITFISVSSVLIREKKKEGKRSNCLVRKTFSTRHQRKNKFGANQFGLQVDTNSREFPMIIADSREV